MALVQLVDLRGYAIVNPDCQPAGHAASRVAVAKRTSEADIRHAPRATALQISSRQGHPASNVCAPVGLRGLWRPRPWRA